MALNKGVRERGGGGRSLFISLPPLTLQNKQNQKTRDPKPARVREIGGVGEREKERQRQKEREKNEEEIQTEIFMTFYICRQAQNLTKQCQV